MKFLPHKHRNLLLLILGVILAVIFSQASWFTGDLGHLGNLSYLVAFVAGMMFASTFTVATGALILLNLAKEIPPLGLIILGGLGAVTTDFLIFHFIKDDVVQEITPIYDEITGSHLKKLLHTRYFAWTLPVLGAIIILSPLPDELGISLLGVEQVKTGRFMIISLVSHTIGMVVLISASSLL